MRIDFKYLISYFKEIDEAKIIVLCIALICILWIIDAFISIYLISLVKIKLVKNMALKGIRSLKEDNELSKDICDYLVQEGFKVATKSIKPEYTIIKGTLKYYKELGGNDQSVYRAFITTREVVIEVQFLDNNSPADIFHEYFHIEEEFVFVYNHFIQKINQILE